MNILREIFAHKKVELEQKRRELPLEELIAKVADAPSPRGFRSALMHSRHDVALIAEVKKASPSEGVIRPIFDPTLVALSYAEAGADCLSVLTDRNYFQGANEYLVACHQAVDVPILRKDFTIDAYDVYEARAIGADAVLLIVAMLEETVLEDLYGLIISQNMDALVEVHDQREADVALRLGANLIGINNRDLRSMTTDISRTAEIAPQVGNSALIVSESGLSSQSDIAAVRSYGAEAVLIGTVFCRAEDPGTEVKRVMGW